ncbi:PhzF family phenazine biosynthesis protein [Asaia siamensis]
MELRFQQVDVFSAEPFKGNPLAVVTGADSLTDAQMAAIANWTNLSETTFLLKPTSPEADYRVRIFTPHGELPFAGHPTLGSAHVWQTLARSSGDAPEKDLIVQECTAGLVPIRRQAGGLAFAAPPRRRTGPASQEERDRAIEALRLDTDAVLDIQWADNGPGWLVVHVDNRDTVLAIKPDWAALVGQKLGVVGEWNDNPAATGACFEVRAFVGENPGYEDPVTGSLNASIGQLLIETGKAPDSYTAFQGTALGRAGQVSVEKLGDDIWVGGAVVTRINGTITL